MTVTMPVEFHVQDKWPFLAKGSNLHHPIVPSSEILDELAVAKTIAFKCINYRGAIAHGKETDIFFGFSDVSNNDSTSTHELFQNRGGSKIFESVEDIKTEIMTCGPDVSTSFYLTQGFLNAGEHSSYFHASLVGGNHALLIVGWKLSAFGEMWLARSIRGSHDIPIAIGQFSIEDKVLAPTNDFSQYAWQNEKKAFDMEGIGQYDWYSWGRLECSISDGRLSALFQALGCSVSEALKKENYVVVRDAKKKARSRAAYLKNITWVEDTKSWSIKLSFAQEVDHKL